MLGKTTRKKTLSVILLIVLITTAFIGCGASSSDGQAPGQPVISQSAGGEEEEDAAGEEAEDEAPSQVAEKSSSQAEAAVTGNPPPSKTETIKADDKLKCTFSINCGTVFDHPDNIDIGILETLPEDGWIYPPREVKFTEGDSVFDILLRVTREAGIHMESSATPAFKSKYVEGIHNLYEFDAGELSGWTYKVNGKGVGYGSSSSYPKDGDVIEWVYTCDQGRDVGVIP